MAPRSLSRFPFGADTPPSLRELRTYRNAVNDLSAADKELDSAQKELSAHETDVERLRRKIEKVLEPRKKKFKKAQEEAKEDLMKNKVVVVATPDDLAAVADLIQASTAQKLTCNPRVFLKPVDGDVDKLKDLAGRYLIRICPRGEASASSSKKK